jgi:hypothetical protein
MEGFVRPAVEQVRVSLQEQAGDVVDVRTPDA